MRNDARAGQLVEEPGKHGNRRFHVGHGGDGGGQDFVDFRGVNVDVNDFRARTEFPDCAHRAVVKADAEREHEVAFIHRAVRGARAVHSDHSGEIPVRRADTAQPHQRGDGRKPVFCGEQPDFPRGGRRIAAAAAEQDGPPGLQQHSGGLPHEARKLLRAGVKADGRRFLNFRPAVKFAFGELHVARHVDQDGARPSARGDRERRGNRSQKLPRRLNQHTVLGNREGQSERVGLLKGVRPDQIRVDLPCNRDNRNGVAPRVGHRRQQVHDAGAARGEADGGLPRRTRHSLRDESARLLLTHKDVPDLTAGKLVVERQNRAAGNSRGRPDSVHLQQPHNHLRACPFHKNSCRYPTFSDLFFQ